MTARVWIVHVNPSILGPIVVQGRPKGGTLRTAAQMPAALRMYLNLPDDLTAQPVIRDFARIEELDAVALDECLLRRSLRGQTRILTIRLPESVLPQRRKRQIIPTGELAIRSLRQLCAYFGADTPRSLNRRVYKDTECGASISLQLQDGSWLHNGQAGWDTLDIKARIQGFTLQTIVEGSDAEVNSDTFYLPVRESEVKAWLADMEAEADQLWHEANDEKGEDQ